MADAGILVENSDLPGVRQAQQFNTKLPMNLIGAAATITTAGNATIGGNLTVTGTLSAGSEATTSQVITAASANAFTVGANGVTNPVFNVDTSTASVATGLNVKGAAAASGVAVTVLSSGTDETLTVDAKGAGVIKIGTTSTGLVKVAEGARKGMVVGNLLTTLSSQNVTPTAAQLLGGVVEHVTATGGGTATLPTGTNLSTAVTGVTVGDSFTCLYINSGNQTGTITGATGSTVIGTAAVTAGKNAIMTFYNTGSNTWNVYVNVSA